jgi:hypothetical protein
MGDRTSVTLTVLKEQAIAAQAVFADSEPDHKAENGGVIPVVYYSFYDVNYGDLPFLDALQNAGIAFDSEWDNGGDYTSGCDFCRFRPDGTVQRNSYSDEYKNPDLHRMMGLLDEPEALKAYILDHHKNITPLPWDNQVEYGKLYLTKKLINPNPE